MTVSSTCLLSTCSVLLPTFLGLTKNVVSDCLEGRTLSLYSHGNRKRDAELLFNCYGFIAYLLQESHPAAYETLYAFMNANEATIPVSIDNIPCPFHYSAFFSSLIASPNHYWESVLDFKELIPGDIIVYLPRGYIPQTVTEIQKGRTGTHLMIVEDVLRVETNLIEVMIIDCTRFRHCQEDSRQKGGIGRAPLLLHKEEGGMMIQWGSREKKWEKDLFFGRLKKV